MSLPSSRAQVAPAAVRGCHRPARRHADAAERDRRRSASRSRSSLRGRAASGRRRPRGSWRAALNCVNGPTADPCGNVRCLHRNRRRAATWTCSRSTPPPTRRSTTCARSSSPASGSRPARDRYKIFIIDEVHRLSGNAFDALLKSIEEPPPHVVFMMATTELDEGPGDHPVALAGLRAEDDRRQADRRPAPSRSPTPSRSRSTTRR